MPDTSLNFYENLMYLISTISETKLNYKAYEIEFILDFSVLILKKVIVLKIKKITNARYQKSFQEYQKSKNTHNKSQDFNITHKIIF